MSSLRTSLMLCILVAALLLAAGCTGEKPTDSCDSDNGTCPLPDGTIISTHPTASPSAPAGEGDRVRIETSMGDIVIELDPAMPITAGNFKDLVQSGYYDGVIFHRIIDGFMIQGGDPTGTGRGGPGYFIQDEFATPNRNDRGTIAMANAGPNTGGSQFFINLVDNNRLDSKHPVFGHVIEGMDVVDAIGKVPTTGYPTNRPLTNVTIIRATII